MARVTAILCLPPDLKWVALFELLSGTHPADSQISSVSRAGEIAPSLRVYILAPLVVTLPRDIALPIFMCSLASLLLWTRRRRLQGVDVVIGYLGDCLIGMTCR